MDPLGMSSLNGFVEMRGGGGVPLGTLRIFCVSGGILGHE